MPEVSYYRSLKRSLSDCADRLKAVQQTLEDKNKAIKELREQNLRYAADLDNFQKRIREEQEILTAYASEHLIKELLPVLDSLENANDDGVRAIRKQIESILEKEGLSAIDDTEQFDPVRHEVVGVEEGGQANKISKVVRKGYILKGKVIRPELVIIKKGD
ncbi:MAG: nucleotide exchange factor GrpE [Thermoplasmatales archaeon]